MTMQNENSSLGQAYILRVICAVSVGFGLFWMIGLVTDILYGFDLTGRALVTFLVVAVAFLVIVPTFWPRNFLAPPAKSPLPRFLLTLVGASALGYVLLIPFFALFGWALIAVAGSDGRPHAEDGRLIVLISIWLPLWWASSVGSLSTWLWLRRMNRRKEDAG